MAEENINPETAKSLFFEGAVFMFLDVPQNTEFGIDYDSWHVGPNFKGVKMIPPGLHFIYYSAVNKELQTSPRTGFWYYFKPKDILIRKWDKILEDAVDVTMSEKELETFRENLTDLDCFLAPYPYSNWKKWISLSNFISETLMEKLQPLNKKISSVTELVSEVSPPSKRQRTSESKLPLFQTRPGTEIRFSKFPQKPFPEGSSPSEVSKHHMDLSYSLTYMIQNYTVIPSDILGEIQFAFICFLVGQVYEAFESWKKLIHLMCFCQDALNENKQLFFDLIFVLHFQLKEIPKDFFVDIVSKDNFLTTTLQVFFSTLKDHSIDSELRSQGEQFKNYLKRKFKWDFESEPEDYAPTVVEI